MNIALLVLQLLQLVSKETPEILDAIANIKAKRDAGKLTPQDWEDEKLKFNPDLSDPLKKIPTPPEE